MDIVKIIELALGGTGAFALFWTGFKGNLSNDTISLMKENKAAADAAIQRLEETSAQQATQIAELHGQVKMLKDIPLAQIAKSLEIVSNTHKDMQDFLNDHQAQAAGLADGIAEKVINYLKDNQHGNTN